MQRKIFKKESQLSTEEVGDSALVSFHLLKTRKSCLLLCPKTQCAQWGSGSVSSKTVVICEDLLLITKLSLYLQDGW